MSRSVNSVTLIGNLGRDPEVRTTAGGVKVATFSLATSRQWVSEGSKKQERTEWHHCVVWNRTSDRAGLADIVERYAKRGDKLYVEGRVEYRQYEDKEKQTRYVTEINVRELMLLSSPRDAGSETSDSRDSMPVQPADELEPIES